MAETDSLQDPYLVTMDPKTSEHLNIFNKEITGLSESNRYDLTSSKWTDFYQDPENAVATFGFNVSVQVFTAIYPGNVPTEFKNIIDSYNSITRSMIYYHCENMWTKNSRSGMGRIRTSDSGTEPDDE